MVSRLLKSCATPAGELAHGLHLLGLPHGLLGHQQLAGPLLDAAFQCGVEVVERLVARQACRLVAGDLEIADLPARLVPQRPYAAIEEHATAVLAQVPAHVGRASSNVGPFELLLGLACLTILGGEEDVDGAPDDLVRRVAERRRRSRRPTGDGAVGRGGQDGIVGRGLDDEPQPLLAFPQLLVGTLQISDVVALDEEARNDAFAVEDRLVDEIDEAALGRAALARLQPDLDPATDEGLTRRIDLIEQAEEDLTVQLAQGIADGKADDLATADESHVSVVGQLEAVLRPPQDGHEARRLHEEVAHPVALSPQDEVCLGHGAGTGEDPAVGVDEVHGTFLADRLDGVAEALQLGDVDGLLQHQGDFAVGSEDRRVGDAPVSLVEAAPLGIRARDVETQQRQRVGLPRPDHGLEGFDRKLQRLGVGRKSVPGPPSDDVGEVAPGGLQVSPVGADDMEPPVQHEVGVG